MKIKKYIGGYPSAARYLIEEEATYLPKQVERVDLKTKDGIDITYLLRKMGPASFATYIDSLLLLAYQEMLRYNEYPWKYAKFVVSVGTTKVGKRMSIPKILDWTAHMHKDPEVVVYGLGYEFKGQTPLKDVAERILDITKRYPKGVSKQAPFKVLKLVICIRD